MKDGLNQGIPITIGEIIAEANKHAATDKTKDQEEVGKGQGGSSQNHNQNHNQNQHQNQNHGGTKRPYETPIWWPTPVQEIDTGITTLKVIKLAGRVLRKSCRVRVLAMLETAGVGIPYSSVLICNSGETTRQTVAIMEVETMDIEVIMEDLATMAEEPEIIQDPAMVEETKEVFSKTLSNCMITRGSIM